MTITERIFFLMDKRGLSQNAFGKAAGIAPSTISDWKRKSHTPSADKIMDICRVLDVSPEQLLTGKDIDEDFGNLNELCELICSAEITNKIKLMILISKNVIFQ